MEIGKIVETFKDLIHQIDPNMGEILLNLLGALTVLIFGYLLAHSSRILVYQGFTQMDKRLPSLSLSGRLRKLGIRPSFFEVISKVVFWIFILLTITAATEILELKIIATWLSGLTTYLPRLLSVALIGFIGIAVGNGVREAVMRASSATGGNYAYTLGKIAQMVIWTATTVVVIGQLGIDIEFLGDLSIVILGVMFAAGALSFGLGSKIMVSNILASYYLQKHYQLGQVVRIEGVEGSIIEMTPTVVILETKEGQVMIPAKSFSEQTSTLLTKRNYEH